MFLAPHVMQSVDVLFFKELTRSGDLGPSTTSNAIVWEFPVTN